MWTMITEDPDPDPDSGGDEAGQKAGVQARKAQRQMEQFAGRLELALQSAPRNTSRDLRRELQEISDRLREVASSLGREIDSGSFDLKAVRFQLGWGERLIELLKSRGVAALLSRGLATGAATAIGWVLLGRARRSRRSGRCRT